MNLFTRFPKLDHPRIESAIAAAERLSSGEIRVVVSRHPAPEPVADARREFTRLGMDRTVARNGVLIFLAPRSRTFAVIGDNAIHARCGDEFWREVAAAMEAAFRNDDFTSGLVLGIERTGTLLATHFPLSPDDHNELPNQVEIV